MSTHTLIYIYQYNTMSIYYNVYHTHTQSFDREEFEMEILRRSSSSICTSGLFSLNADQGVVNVSVDADAGYTCELFCLFLLFSGPLVHR